MIKIDDDEVNFPKVGIFLREISELLAQTDLKATQTLPPQKKEPRDNRKSFELARIFLHRIEKGHPNLNLLVKDIQKKLVDLNSHEAALAMPVFFSYVAPVLQEHPNLVSDPKPSEYYESIPNNNCWKVYLDHLSWKGFSSEDIMTLARFIVIHEIHQQPIHEPKKISDRHAQILKAFLPAAAEPHSSDINNLALRFVLNQLGHGYMGHAYHIDQSGRFTFVAAKFITAKSRIKTLEGKIILNDPRHLANAFRTFGLSVSTRNFDHVSISFIMPGSEADQSSATRLLASDPDLWHRAHIKPEGIRTHITLVPEINPQISTSTSPSQITHEEGHSSMNIGISTQPKPRFNKGDLMNFGYNDALYGMAAFNRSHLHHSIVGGEPHREHNDKMHERSIEGPRRIDRFGSPKKTATRILEIVKK